MLAARNNKSVTEGTQTVFQIAAVNLTPMNKILEVTSCVGYHFQGHQELVEFRQSKE